MPILYVNRGVTKILFRECVVFKPYFDNYSFLDILYEFLDILYEFLDILYEFLYILYEFLDILNELLSNLMLVVLHHNSCQRGPTFCHFPTFIIKPHKPPLTG